MKTEKYWGKNCLPMFTGFLSQRKKTAFHMKTRSWGGGRGRWGFRTPSRALSWPPKPCSSQTWVILPRAQEAQEADLCVSFDLINKTPQHPPEPHEDHPRMERSKTDIICSGPHLWQHTARWESSVFPFPALLTSDQPDRRPR